VEPYALPAATAIDWGLPGQRIGDRHRPLAAATIARIEAGLRRYGHQPTLVPAGGTWRNDPTPVGEPFTTRTTSETDAMVVPYYSGDVTADPATQPLRTLTATDRFGVAFLAELRGGGSTARPVTSPLSTLSAGGTHHMLVRHHTARGDAGQMSTPVTEPIRTVLASSRQSLLSWGQQPPVVEDCTFRMLQPGEIQAAMAFRSDYRVLGNKREQVRQLGNAVTPPAAEVLIRALATVLHDTAPTPRGGGA
jgi:DNA (cytosine-5)-methyltransferase 1